MTPITWPSASTIGPPESPGAVTAASTNTSRSVGWARVMSVPRATICSAMRTGAWRSGPPPGWPKSAPRSSTLPSPSSSAGSASPGTRRIARSRLGRTRPRWRRGDGRRSSSTRALCSPATTWAFVTTRFGPATNPVPSWMRSHACPSTRSVDLVTRVAASAGMPSAGGVPASGDDRVSNTSGKLWSPTSRPSVSDSEGGAGATRSMRRATALVAHGAGSPPGRVRQRGDEQPHQDEDAGDARARHPRRDRPDGVRRPTPEACRERAPDGGADGLRDRRDHHHEGERRQQAVRGGEPRSVSATSARAARRPPIRPRVRPTTWCAARNPSGTRPSRRPRPPRR